MLPTSLSLSLFLLADADPKSFDSDNVFFYITAVLVDEGRENPNTTKAGRHRPASKTPFDGLGSFREHKSENSLNFRGIAMGLYRGWQGGGLYAPSFPWIPVCMRIVRLLNFSACLSVYQSVCLSKSLYMYMPVCLHVSLPPPLSLSLSLSLSQRMWYSPSRPGSPSSIPGNSSL